MAHKPEADRADHRPEHGARSGVRDLACQDAAEIWPRGQRERAHRDDHDGGRGNQPFRAHGVDKSAARYLRPEANEAAYAQDEANVGLRPFLGGQVDRNKWAEPGLSLGEKKDEQIKSALTAE